MKTGMEWIATIKDEGIKAEAVCNAMEEGDADRVMQYFNSLCATFYGSFLWVDTPQGGAFWDDIAITTYDGEEI